MDKAKTTQVIGIASGKGGVGKTTVSVNLAVALQAMGFRVMLFDADMSLANAQIALGVRCPYNLSHFLSGEKTLAEIIVTTRQGVKLVPGASGIQEMAALGEMQASPKPQNPFYMKIFIYWKNYINKYRIKYYRLILKKKTKNNYKNKERNQEQLKRKKSSQTIQIFKKFMKISFFILDITHQIKLQMPMILEMLNLILMFKSIQLFLKH
jgi:hypothetical protein